MTNLNKVIERAREECKTLGIRLTKKRQNILTCLLMSERAISAYELRDYCEALFNDQIPPKSVYRILDLLQEAGLVHKLSLAKKYVACAHITCDHAHDALQFLICVKCQRVEEISISRSVSDSLKKEAESVGFSLISPQLEINSLCQNC